MYPRAYKWNTYIHTWHLWMRLLKIDRKAAEYIMLNTYKHRKHPIDASEYKLIELFSWGSTPQQHEYWMHINEKLNQRADYKDV